MQSCWSSGEPLLLLPLLLHGSWLLLLLPLRRRRRRQGSEALALLQALEVLQQLQAEEWLGLQAQAQELQEQVQE